MKAAVIRVMLAGTVLVPTNGLRSSDFEEGAGNQIRHLYSQVRDLQSEIRRIEDKIDRIGNEQSTRHSLVYGTEKQFDEFDERVASQWKFFNERIDKRRRDHYSLSRRVDIIEDQRKWEGKTGSNVAKEVDRLYGYFWWLVGVLLVIAIPALLDYGRHARRYVKKNLTIYGSEGEERQAQDR